MAFSWIGLKSYVDWADAKYAEELKKQDEKEAMVFGLAAKYGVDFLSGGDSTTLAGASGTTAGFDQTAKSPYGIALKTLQSPNHYGLDDEVLAPIVASGDKTAAPKLLDILEKQRLKYEELGLQMPQTVVQQIVESAVTTQPAARKIDFTKIEEYIGREMDDMYKAVLTAQGTKAGQVFIPEPAFVERPGLEDIDKFEQRAVKFNITRAAEETRMLQKKVSELQGISETTSLTTQQQLELDWLTSRLVQVQDAIQANQDDNVVPIVGLYGNTYIDQLVGFYPNFKEAPLNPALLNAAQQQVTVPNRAVAESLAAAGILKQGDTVLNLETNKKIKIGG